MFRIGEGCEVWLWLWVDGIDGGSVGGLGDA